MENKQLEEREELLEQLRECILKLNDEDVKKVTAFVKNLKAGGKMKPNEFLSHYNACKPI